jgi:6-phosphogluconolactonase (cycloisomerase 2 family)
VILDPDDDYAFVANTFDLNFSTGSQRIARYDLDASGLVAAGPVYTSYSPKPEHFAMDPCGQFLLHTEQPGQKVRTGDIGPTGDVTNGGSRTAGPGALRLVLVPLDAGLCVESAVYVTNELEDTVSVFVANADGELTFVEKEDAGHRPEDLIKHPTADVLYVLSAGDFTGLSIISIFDIDPATGELTLAGTEPLSDEGAHRLAIRSAP